MGKQKKEKCGAKSLDAWENDFVRLFKKMEGEMANKKFEMAKQGI